jgi:hypothetical protein
MAQPSLQELERICQKPEYRRIGNWMARRISRPMALRVTRIVAPCGMSANLATLVAWAFAMGAVAAFAWGTPGGWLLGALLLQLWYLWDHVDGQLARLRGTASLDGVQLDYLMHHMVNLTLPMGIGWGLFAQSSQPLWLLGGLTWGLALLGLGLQHDARYKAFIQRLKILDGTVETIGGAGFRSLPQPPIPRHPRQLATWTLHKLCEMHVIMNVLGLLALGQWLFGDVQLWSGRCYLLLCIPLAALLTVATIVRSQQRQACEEEFHAWFRLPAHCELQIADGRWRVVPTEAGEIAQTSRAASTAERDSS